jgi:hypothetical protein
MMRLRRALAPIAAIWLSCQLGAVALVPVALWAGAAAERTAGCTCGHGTHAMCPMHHHKPAGSSSSTCSMQPVNSGPSAVLTVLVGPPGFIPGSPSSLVVPDLSTRIAHVDAGVRGERPVPPDPPPPRA